MAASRPLQNQLCPSRNARLLYDMVGFNDTHFATRHHTCLFYEITASSAPTAPTCSGTSDPMGCKPGTASRALDFLESFARRDRKRLACTAESGGGTQTFMLGAVTTA